MTNIQCGVSLAGLAWYLWHVQVIHNLPEEMREAVRREARRMFYRISLGGFIACYALLIALGHLNRSPFGELCVGGALLIWLLVAVVLRVRIFESNGVRRSFVFQDAAGLLIVGAAVIVTFFGRHLWR